MQVPQENLWIVQQVIKVSKTKLLNRFLPIFLDLRS